MTAAKKDDWQTKPFPAITKSLAFERCYTPQEMEQIKLGLVPREMEDKWFIYEENGVLNFCRSWTGHHIYQLHFTAADGGYSVSNTIVNRYPAEYNQDDDAYDIAFLNYLIDRLLLNKEVPFPSPGQIEQDKAAIFRHSMVGYGRSNKDA